jgi:hypothetical protein
MTTWRELKAQGVHRCNAMFKDGTQCRRRALPEWNNSWCAKHGPIMKAHADHAIKVMLEMQTNQSTGDNDEF